MKLSEFPDVTPETAKRWLVVPKDWRRPSVAGEYEIIWDSSRSFGQIWPRPKSSDVVSFYEVEEYYTHHVGSTKRDQQVSLSQRVITKLSWWRDNGVEPDARWWKSTLGSKKLRILEVGCGNGANLKLFRSLGHDVVGVEPDKAALEVARGGGLTVYQGTAEALPAEVASEQFDVVVFMHVLEHCVDVSSAIKNAASVMRSGGLFVAEVPNNECLGAKRFGEFWYWLDVPRHLNFFTETSLGALVSSAGFEVETFCFRGYCRQFSKDWKAAQERIADVFGLSKDGRVRGLSYWRYLISSANAKGGKKYDSVRVVAVLA